ncbi:MAG: phosphoesterase PA-phosphatase related protein [Bacteroidetes bacterium]|nr:phosphoesterase PA-phosphatase related protein [Bacteroidota bacterium]
MYKITTIILLCIIFLLLSVKTYAQNTDIEILSHINQESSSFLRDYSKLASNTTKVAGLAVPVVIGAVALINQDDDLLKSGIYIAASQLATVALTYSFKLVVDRPRPYITYPDKIVAYDALSSSSFPSGHTSFAFATATSLSIEFPKWYVIAPSYLWACSVGYSRMNLGVHYPSDVLVGALLGAGSAYLTYKLNQWFWKKCDNKKLIGLQTYL